MDSSTQRRVLAERARLAAQVVRQTGECHFPWAHPECLHQTWLTPERTEAAVAAASLAEVDPDPFAPGPAGGLSLWDRAAAPTPWTEFRTMPPQRVPAFRKTNATWLEETVPSFYRVGMPVDGVVVRRPQSPAIVDLMGERWGWRLLEAAHALAHRAEVQARFRPQAMGLYGSLTLNWVAGDIMTGTQYLLVTVMALSACGGGSTPTTTAKPAETTSGTGYPCATPTASTRRSCGCPASGCARLSRTGTCASSRSACTSSRTPRGSRTEPASGWR